MVLEAIEKSSSWEPTFDRKIPLLLLAPFPGSRPEQDAPGRAPVDDAHADVEVAGALHRIHALQGVHLARNRRYDLGGVRGQMQLWGVGPERDSEVCQERVDPAVERLQVLLADPLHGYVPDRRGEIG